MQAARRRVWGKSPPTVAQAPLATAPQELAATFVNAAMAADSEDLQHLARGVKRSNIHWTHVRTFNPAWVQPEQVSREETWAHLERIYKEVYPLPGSPTGSVLAFGVVCQERHAAGADDATRALHRHVASGLSESGRK